MIRLGLTEIMNPGVLLVDDELDSIEVLEEYLGVKGINVIAKARDGEEAAKVYQDLKPDVVLMDVLMPKYDGFYGLRKIREADPNAKVIMVTGSVDTSTGKELKDLGASAIIFKPYDIDDVVHNIHQITKEVAPTNI